MGNQKFIAHVTAQSKETGETKTFIESLDNVGELLNNLIMSGYHNITNAQVVDAEPTTTKNHYVAPTINFSESYNASVAERLV